MPFPTFVGPDVLIGTISECDADKLIIKGEHTMPKEFTEQLAIMHQAASQGADILVEECMAVAPDLQYISQHKMVA